VATHGLVTVAMAIDIDAERVIAGPHVSAVGMVMRLDDALRDEMVVALRESIESMLARGQVDRDRLQRRVENITASYIYRGRRRRPRIQPVILDVTDRHFPA
jgi:mRNA degradation ribonuclease J1/J2